MSKSEIPPPETPSVQPEVPPPPKRRFGKKLYLAIGIVAIVAIILVLVFAFFNPLGQGAPVGLGVNYVVGESMTYNVTMSTTVTGQQPSSTTITVNLQVLSFDGDNYTLRATVSSAPSQSVQFKLNKNGYIADVSQLPPELLQMYYQYFVGGFPGILSPLPKQNVKIGETVSTPLNMNISGPIVTGSLNWKFSEMADVTVPAGTYKTFKVDLTSKDIQATYMGMTAVTVSISCYMHFENDTGRLVDLNLQVTASGSAGFQSGTATITAQVQLIQDVKP